MGFGLRGMARNHEGGFVLVEMNANGEESRFIISTRDAEAACAIAGAALDLEDGFGKTETSWGMAEMEMTDLTRPESLREAIARRKEWEFMNSTPNGFLTTFGLSGEMEEKATKRLMDTLATGLVAEIRIKCHVKDEQKWERTAGHMESVKGWLSKKGKETGLRLQDEIGLSSSNMTEGMAAGEWMKMNFVSKEGKERNKRRM